MENSVSSSLSYWLLITFLPKKQCLFPAKNFNSSSVERKSLTENHYWPRFQWTFPKKQPTSAWVTESDSVLFTDGDYVIL